MEGLIQRARSQSRTFDFEVIAMTLKELRAKVATEIAGLDLEGYKAEKIGEPESIQPCGGSSIGPFTQKIRISCK